MSKKLAPVHPGEVLREEFLLPLKLSPYAVSKATSVPRTRIERLAREEVALTADTALRLAAYFGRRRRSGSAFKCSSISRGPPMRRAESNALSQ
jgi:addiction module HigA family antidote